jgi:hypothetical protein
VWTLVAKPGDAPFSFTSATLSAKVRYPTHGETRTLAKGDAGAKIDGHRVTVQSKDGAEVAGFAQGAGIAAFDAGGRPLKRFSTVETSDAGTTYAFMGHIAKVRVSLVSAWVDRNVSGTLTPAPPRPKDKAGSCD